MAEPKMKKTGRTGKGCPYFKRLAELDTNTLKELVTQSVDKSKSTYK